MFPKKEAISDGGLISIGLRFINKRFDLKVDRLKCVGCGVCSIVCPKSAILCGPSTVGVEQESSAQRKTQGAVLENDEFRLEILNPDKCVYCGTCTIFCPFDAIHLYEDDVRVNPEDLVLVQKNALPKLEGKNVYCSAIDRDAFVYWEGELEIVHEVPEDLGEFKMEYLHSCPGDCRKCETICPTDAISFKSLKEGFESKQIIVVDEEKCIECGACVQICPSDNFTLKRSKINVSGPYNKIFWKPIEERLKEDKVLTEPED